MEGGKRRNGEAVLVDAPPSLALMCRAKSEIVSCETCNAAISQTLGKGRARRYCGKCLLKRHRVGQRQMACCVCAKTWTRKGPGRAPKYCSSRCRHVADKPKRRKEVTCERCHAPFVSKSGSARLCNQCCHWRPCHGNVVECQQCRREFYRTPCSVQAYCSLQCQYAAKKVWHTCLHCGQQFSRRKYRANDKRQYCRMQCYWDAHGMDGSVAAKLKGRWAGNTRKRCRKAGVPYDPTVTIDKVAERDAYQCQLCGNQCNMSWMVDRRSRKPHPRNRTIDHIVPIVAGVHGHEWHNVQCACVSCNLRKGRKWRVSQLRLL